MAAWAPSKEGEDGEVVEDSWASAGVNKQSDAGLPYTEGGCHSGNYSGDATLDKAKCVVVAPG